MSRSPRPCSLTVNAIGSLPAISSTTVVPGAAPTRLATTKPRLSARYSAVCRAAGESIPPGRPTARRTSCSCIHTSRRLRSSAFQSQPTPLKIRSGLAVPSVGGSASSGVPGGGGGADLVDDRVGGLVAAGDDALLGVDAHQAGDVVRLADLDGLLGATARTASRCAMCAATADVPSGQVGRRRPLLGRQLLEKPGEVVHRLPPHVDVAAESFLVRHGGSLVIRGIAEPTPVESARGGEGERGRVEQGGPAPGQWLPRVASRSCPQGQTGVAPGGGPGRRPGGGPGRLSRVHRRHRFRRVVLCLQTTPRGAGSRWCPAYDRPGPARRPVGGWLWGQPPPGVRLAPGVAAGCDFARSGRLGGVNRTPVSAPPSWWAAAGSTPTARLRCATCAGASCCSTSGRSAA